VVDSQRSYFDTNTSDHHHFFFEASGQLDDIPGERVILARLPDPPKGTRVKRVDVVVRLDDTD
jgi:Fur family transcriptional regulator, iron response regulator